MKKKKSDDDGQAVGCRTLIKKKYQVVVEKRKEKAVKGVQKKGAGSVACMRQAEVRNEAWILQRDEMDGGIIFLQVTEAGRQRRVR